MVEQSGYKLVRIPAGKWYPLAQLTGPRTSDAWYHLIPTTPVTTASLLEDWQRGSKGKGLSELPISLVKRNDTYVLAYMCPQADKDFAKWWGQALQKHMGPVNSSTKYTGGTPEYDTLVIAGLRMRVVQEEWNTRDQA